MNVSRLAPKFTINFFDPATGQPLVAAPHHDVVSFHTSKAYGRCLGTWSVALTTRRLGPGENLSSRSGQRYDEIVSSGDLVRLSASLGDGSDPVVIMAGIVTRIAESRRAAGGKYIASINITGDDFGKLLMSEIGWDTSPTKISIGQAESVMICHSDRTLLRVGTPAGMAQQIFDRLAVVGFGNLQGYVQADRITTPDNWTVLNEHGYLLQQTSIWSALKQMENAPYNIAWCDTDDSGVFHLGMERYPLDADGYVNRGTGQTLQVDDRSIISEDIGWSDSERVNLVAFNAPIYQFINQATPIEVVLTNPHLTNYDAASIRQHGYRPHIISTNFVPPNLTEKLQVDVVSPDAVTRAAMFWNWYRFNHELESGSLTVKGIPTVRAGWQLDHQRRGMSYLIEQVNHEFSVWPAPSFTTTLEITRGRKQRAVSSPTN